MGISIVDRKQDRNQYIDFLKGIAIILVVFGHAIQFVSAKQSATTINPIFEFIYIFHMPLFMFLSGYVSFGQMNRDFLSVTVSKIRQLAIPTAILTLCYEFILTDHKTLHDFLSCYWFIWVLIYCTLALKVSLALCKKDYLLFIPIILSYFLPDDYLLSYFKFMFPFYVMGYIVYKYRIKLTQYRTIGYIISILLFVTCFALWRRDYYIYWSETNVWNAGITFSDVFIPYMFRIIGGVSGIIMTVFITKIIYGKQWLRDRIVTVGTMTLGIYFIQLPIFIVISHLKFDIGNPVLYNVVICPIVATCVILISIQIIKLIKMNKYTAMFLLGIYSKSEIKSI